MTQALRKAFEDQARACEALGSPFTAGLMRLLPGLLFPALDVADRMRGWAGDLGPGGASLPLRLAGGLHHLVLTGADPALAECYPPGLAPGLEAAVARALRRHDGFLTGWIDNTPQTNEVGRSAVLIAGATEVAARFGLPLKLSELGASAGLNLLFDRYALVLPGLRLGPEEAQVVLTPEWRGALPPSAGLAVTERRGVDLNPLSAAQDGLRLLSYVWPDQAERLARLRAALRVAAAAPPPLDRADAAGWLEARLRAPGQGACHLVFHTIAFQYFPAGAQDRIRRAIAAAGARATQDAPLAWLAMEQDDTPGSAGVTLHLWPGERRVTLGRAGFHGQWVEWRGL